MGFIRTLILSLYAMLTLCWKLLPIVAVLAGYALFAPPAWLGGIMAAVLGLAGYLAKSTASAVFYKPDTHGSARFAGLADARKGKLLTGKGLILGRKHGRMLRYRGEGHLLTFAPTRSGKGVGCVIPNLLDYPGSVVVTDIKGENSDITRTYGSRSE